MKNPLTSFDLSMNTKTAFLWLIVPLILASCKQVENPEFRNQFRWLAGKWQGEHDGRQFIERWKWNRDHYEGLGIEMEQGDTVFEEQLFLRDIAGHSSYIAVLKEDPPVLFNGTFEKPEKQWVFENKEHEFPSRIIYRQLNDSTIRIFVLGPGNDTRNGYDYQLKRSR